MKSYHYLVLMERREMQRLYEKGFSIAEIARDLNVDRGTIYHELKRGNTGEILPNGRAGYDAEKADAVFLAGIRRRGSK